MALTPEQRSIRDWLDTQMDSRTNANRRVFRIAVGFNYDDDRALSAALREVQQVFEGETSLRIDSKVIESEYFDRLATAKKWGMF
jgi:hypothetical protein